MIDGLKNGDLIFDTADREVIYIISQYKDKFEVICFTRVGVQFDEYLLLDTNYGNRLILLDRENV